MVITIDDITMVRAKDDITTEFFDSKIQSIDPNLEFLRKTLRIYTGAPRLGYH